MTWFPLSKIWSLILNLKTTTLTSRKEDDHFDIWYYTIEDLIYAYIIWQWWPDNWTDPANNKIWSLSIEDANLKDRIPCSQIVCTAEDITSFICCSGLSSLLARFQGCMTSASGAMLPNTVPRDGIGWYTPYSLGCVLTNIIPRDSIGQHCPDATWCTRNYIDSVKSNPSLTRFHEAQNWHDLHKGVTISIGTHSCRPYLRKSLRLASLTRPAPHV